MATTNPGGVKQIRLAPVPPNLPEVINEATRAAFCAAILKDPLVTTGTAAVQAAARYHTLPGSGGELRNEAGELTDTILGQQFASTQPGVINWSMSTNAILKGFAGYVAKLRILGTPITVARADGAMKKVTGEGIPDNTWQLTTSAHTDVAWDPSKKATFYTAATGATAIADSAIESIDYAFGRVTFKESASNPTIVPPTAVFAEVTVWPTTEIGGANSFTLTQTADTIDDTDMRSASNNGGFRTMRYGLKTVSLELSGFYIPGEGHFERLRSREQFIIEIVPDGETAKSNLNIVARGFFRNTSQTQSGAVGELEEQSLTFQLNVPDGDDLLEAPFKWNIPASSTINPAVKLALDAWANENPLIGRYQPARGGGVVGCVIVSDISLSGGLEAMNDFSVTLSGSGEPCQIPIA